MLIQLFRMYSKKSLGEKKIFKYISIIAIVMAVSIIFCAQLILNTYQSNINNRIVAMNGSNVKILDNGYWKHTFNNQQVNMLKSVGCENATLANSGCTNVIAGEKTDSIVLTVFNNNNIVEKNDINLKPDEIILSNNIAKRLNIKQGEEIFIKLHSNTYSDTKVKVVKILKDNVSFSVAGKEIEIAQETLGNGYMVLPCFEKYNTAYIKHLSSEEKRKMEIQFSPDFDVRTLKDLKQKVQPRIDLEINILKLVSGIAMLMSSICLAWCFMLLVMERKDDFAIFKKVGIQRIDLLKLVLLEICDVSLKGSCIGIPIGGIIAAIFMFESGAIYDLTRVLFLRSVFITLFLVGIETLAFSLLPLERVSKMMSNDRIKENQISFTTISFVISSMLVASCIYVQSFVGIIFWMVVITLFGVFYLMLVGMVRILIIFLSMKKRNFLYSKDLKASLTISSFSYTLINISMVICLTLVNILPVLYSSMEKDNEVKQESVIYRTMPQTEAEKELQSHQVTYHKKYKCQIKLLKVNEEDISQCISGDIADEYKIESENTVSDRSIEVYDDKHALDGESGTQGIWVNNIYSNMINFQEGDILTLSIEEYQVSLEVQGTYFASNDKDTIGIVDESILLSQGIPPNTQNETIYTLIDGGNQNLLVTLLLKDENAYIEQGNQLKQYVSTYINAQKNILLNEVIAIGLSSIVLVFLGQIILEARKKEYYLTLWKVGMDKVFLGKKMLLEKISFAFCQVVIITIFYEPLRFLIISEFYSTERYTISLPTIIFEIIVTLGINLLSSILFWIRYDKNK